VIAPVDRADDHEVMASFAPTAVETHISVLFAVGDRMMKLKKPAHLSILDWRERQARERACHREVDLNRRLAPDVYLGVLDVVRDGRPVDHLVEMRRMPDERRLSRLLTEGANVSGALGDLACLLARFHAEAGRSALIDSRATVDAVAARWTALFPVVRDFSGPVASADVLDLAIVERVEELSTRYLAGRRRLFDRRIAEGHIVDGHGDLMAEDIFVLDDGPRVLDCIEFSDELRSVDVLDDVCCLAMDIERFGSAEAATAFLRYWATASGDCHPSSLAHHWIAYRAMVRAHVACLRAEQGRTHAPDDIAEARGLVDLACAHLERGRLRIVAVAGLPGTGKSTVAGAVADALGWPVVHSDIVRKELLGLEPTVEAIGARGDLAYSAVTTTRTYETLLERAGAVVSMGESVVLDATWNDPAMRERLAALAVVTGSELVVLECTAPQAVAAERLASRPEATGSDATAEVADLMAVFTRHWDGAAVLDTTTSLDATVAVALDAVA